MGGISDGFAQKASPKKLSPIFLGGVSDGFALRSTPCIDYDSLVINTNAPLCPGDSLIVNLIATMPEISTYTWTGPNGFTSKKKNFVIADFKAKQEGTYKVVVNPGCVGDEDSYPTASVYIKAKPALLLSATLFVQPQDEICQGRVVQFIVDAKNVGDSGVYTWYVNGEVYQEAPNNSVYVENDVFDGTNVFCQVRSAEGCTSPRELFTNTVKMKVTMVDTVMTHIMSQATSSLDSIVLCSYEKSTTVRSVVQNAGYRPKYLWFKNGVLDASQNAPIYQYTNPAAGDKIQLKIIPNIVCPHDTLVVSNILTVYINQAPNISTIDTISLPAGDTAIIPVNGALNSYTYLWTPNKNIADISNDTAYVWPSSKTIYVVAVSGKNGCTVYDTTVVNTYRRARIINVSRVPNIICEKDSLTLEVVVTGYGVKYQWQVQLPGTTTWANV
ncbi:MAG: hypothetical protein RSA02_04775, partial [Bacteroidales bacterium]